MAALTSFCCAGQQIQPCVCDGSSVTYLRDAAQEAAEYLSANREQPGPPSYPEALQMFSRWTADTGRSPGPAALGQLDEKMARAAANMDYLQQWDADARPGAEGSETGSESKAFTKCGVFLLRFIGNDFLELAETPTSHIAEKPAEISYVTLSRLVDWRKHQRVDKCLRLAEV